ncbi:MAG: thioredoxin domain-containing protein [Candidatus Zixiibacteriota bacterium]|nr:MAG: thioredoxin domain-containing protein [candidate division Zixibacteria bacterium]
MPRSSSSIVALLICTTLLLNVECKSSEPTAAGLVAYTSAHADSKIKWRNWDDAAFADAQKSDKLVFLFLTQPWCAPCEEMETQALDNDKIAAQINQDYLPIKINAERYPNLYDRYHLPGYPSSVVMTPDARVIGGGTYVPAESLAVLLTQISKYWKENRPAVLAQADKMQNLFVQAINRRNPQPPTDVALMLAEAAIKKQYDSTYGGFGNQPKFPQPAINDFMFGAVGPTGGLLFKDIIAKTMDAQLALLDTVWGGFYRYAGFADWSGAGHEKLLDPNAQLLSNYLDAYQITRNEKYRQAAELTINYFDRFLLGGDGWGFSTSQQGVINVKGKFIDPKEYFALSDEGRSKQGTPAVDKSVYTELNCQAIRAYFKAQRVLGRQDCGDYAAKSLDQLLIKARGANDGLYREPLNTTLSAFGLLPDQVAAISALLDAYETRGNKDYLTRAQAIASFVTKYLVDRDSGGVRYEMLAAGNHGRMSIELKPFNPNVDAVIAFTRLYYLTSREEYRNTATGILKYLFNIYFREDDLRLCKLASAYTWTNRMPLTFVVVGKPGDDYRSLLQSAWQTYFPRLVVHHLDPGIDKLQAGKLEFPVTDKPSLYVCLDTLRSDAIDDTATVITKIKDFLRPK